MQQRRRTALDVDEDETSNNQAPLSSPNPLSSTLPSFGLPNDGYLSDQGGDGVTNERRLSSETGGSNSDDDVDGKNASSKRVSLSQLRLTLMEEIMLLGIKDRAGYVSFWNDNISYVLRGCILMELAFRGRIAPVRDNVQQAKMAAQGVAPSASVDRQLDVVNVQMTGEVLLDETLKLMRQDRQPIAQWIDLLSGETWNVLKVGYQLKQVRERLSKGLVDKGVLRTEKRNFVLFDMATHPVAAPRIKQAVQRRVIDCLLGRTARPSLRTVALVCAAYAANVLESSLASLSHADRERAFSRVDALLQQWAQQGQNVNALPPGTPAHVEIMAGVMAVFSKMDSILY